MLLQERRLRYDRGRISRKQLCEIGLLLRLRCWMMLRVKVTVALLR